MKLVTRRGPRWLAARVRTNMVIETTSKVMEIMVEVRVAMRLRAVSTPPLNSRQRWSMPGGDNRGVSCSSA
jgi:hypothetical protein